MSDNKRQSTVGDPLWVESVLTPEEYRACSHKYPTTYVNGPVAVQYNPSYHKSGRWRYKMGGHDTKEEIDKFNAGLEKLRQYHLTKKVEDEQT